VTRGQSRHPASARAPSSSGRPASESAAARCTAPGLHELWRRPFWQHVTSVLHSHTGGAPTSADTPHDGSLGGIRCVAWAATHSRVLGRPARSRELCHAHAPGGSTPFSSTGPLRSVPGPPAACRRMRSLLRECTESAAGGPFIMLRFARHLSALRCAPERPHGVSEEPRNPAKVRYAASPAV
jgi:hypothetical protein